MYTSATLCPLIPHALYVANGRKVTKVWTRRRPDTSDWTLVTRDERTCHVCKYKVSKPQPCVRVLLGKRDHISSVDKPLTALLCLSMFRFSLHIQDIPTLSIYTARDLYLNLPLCCYFVDAEFNSFSLSIDVCRAVTTRGSARGKWCAFGVPRTQRRLRKKYRKPAVKITHN